VSSVPANTLDAVGAGTVSTLPVAITGNQPALTANGKPLVVYLGAEYCPYCAAERWAMVVALFRFGSFTNLGATHSASEDIYPNTATLSFHGATYSSNYLDFQGVETQTNQRSGNTYTTLDTPTVAQAQLAQKFNAPPYVSSAAAGAIPFVDFGNRYLISGASYGPQILAGLSSGQIASALSDPTNPVAMAVDGTANAITAVLCKLTNGQPASVCTSKAVTAFQGKL
jgi:thiol-disulfide isomerase/thioredoxin